jgi:hypothetical protein
MTNMKLRLTSFIAVLFSIFLAHAQQLDPIHYPAQAKWEYLQTKETDSLIEVMKFYFLSDDTLFFREASSLQVVKVALVDLEYPAFYLGKDYFFASRFYGPNAANMSRTSKNEKLDRFYFYYLNSPELVFSKTLSEQQYVVKSDIIPKSRPLVLDSAKVQVYDTKLGQVDDSAAYLYLKNGKTIQTKKIYFESNGCYYFGSGVRRNVYKILASEVDSVRCPKPINDLDLANHRWYGVVGGIMQCYGCSGMVVGTFFVTISIWFEFPAGIILGTAIDGLSTYIMVCGTQRVLTMQRYKKALQFLAPAT